MHVNGLIYLFDNKSCRLHFTFAWQFRKVTDRWKSSEE